MKTSQYTRTHARAHTYTHCVVQQGLRNSLKQFSHLQSSFCTWDFLRGLVDVVLLKRTVQCFCFILHVCWHVQPFLLSTVGGFLLPWLIVDCRFVGVSFLHFECRYIHCEKLKSSTVSFHKLRVTHVLAALYHHTGANIHQLWMLASLSSRRRRTHSSAQWYEKKIVPPQNNTDWQFLNSELLKIHFIGYLCASRQVPASLIISGRRQLTSPSLWKTV